MDEMSFQGPFQWHLMSEVCLSPTLAAQILCICQTLQKTAMAAKHFSPIFTSIKICKKETGILICIIQMLGGFSLQLLSTCRVGSKNR